MTEVYHWSQGIETTDDSESALEPTFWCLISMDMGEPQREKGAFYPLLGLGPLNLLSPYATGSQDLSQVALDF